MSSTPQQKNPLHVGRALIAGAVVGVLAIVVQLIVSGFNLPSTLILLGVLAIALLIAWLVLHLINRDRIPSRSS